jgi:hypothetical protein
LYAYDSSTVTMSGGTAETLAAVGSATVTMSGGAVNSCVAAYHTSTVTIDGGTMEGVLAENTSTVTINGGTVEAVAHPSPELKAFDSSTITIVGSNFEVDGAPVPYGDLAAQSGTLTGTRPFGDDIDNVFYQGGYTGTPCSGEPCNGTITLAASPLVPALPLPGYLALVAGLLGAAALLRRAG